MLDKEVNKIYLEFVSYWNKRLEVNSSILLDGSWPSIGVLDLLTFSLRYREQVPAQLQSIFSGSSAYIAYMLCQCWKDTVDDLHVYLKEGRVSLEAKGGELLPNNQIVIVPIEELLRERLKTLPNPFPVTKDFSSEILFDSNVLSLFCIGLFTAQIDGIEGRFSEMSKEQLRPLIDVTKKFLATTCARHYATNYSEEPLGQMSELYLQDLIYPPMMMSEELPCMGSIQKLLEYFEESGVNKKAALALGQNLSLSPDHLLSNIGIILTLGLSESMPPPAVIAVARKKGNTVGFLRRAVLLVRKHYGEESDWANIGLQSKKADICFIVEQNLKLLPCLNIHFERLKADASEGLLLPLVAASCDFNYELGEEICEIIIKELPDDIDIHMQLAHFKMLQGEYEEADKRLNNLIDKPNADNSIHYYNMRGMCALSLKQNDRALRYFKTALKIADGEDIIFESELFNNIAWASILNGKYAEALLYLGQSLAKSIYPITAMLNKASLLWDLGQVEDYSRLRKFLLQMCPTDRRVFAHLTLDPKKDEQI